MNFTKVELKEIEKLFDIAAGQTARSNAEFIMAFSKIKGTEKYLERLFKECRITFDMYRTISAKANEMQKEVVERIDGGQ